MNLICKFNFDDSAESKKNNLSKYDGIPGVWALRGKDKRADADEQEDKWICLQVGQTQDIKIEIEKDIKDMEKSRKVSDKEICRTETGQSELAVRYCPFSYSSDRM